MCNIVSTIKATASKIPPTRLSVEATFLVFSLSSLELDAPTIKRIAPPINKRPNRRRLRCVINGRKGVPNRSLPLKEYKEDGQGIVKA